MTSTTKETERAELHKTIWRIANDMRGSVDGWDFKTYVLGMLFYRFISENLTAYLNEAERKAGDADFDYRRLPNADAEFGREETVKEKGFYILPQDLFANVRERARTDENLNETLSRVFTNIEASAVGADSEDDIKGLFADLDVNSGKLGPTVAKRNEKLVKLLDAIGDLNFGNDGFTHNTIDAFGDAYEYLMGMYAANAGKSGGEYYTPAGGLRAPGADHRGRQDRGQQGVRPRVRFRVAAAAVQQGAARWGPQGLLRSGDQPDHLQPVPDQHVPARRQLRAVRHRPRRHADRPGALGRRAVRGDRVQPALLDQVGGRREPAADQRRTVRPGRRAGPEVEGRPRLHDAHAALARRRRHGRDRRVPRRALPRRRGAEDPQVPDRQQLRRRRDPAPAGSLLRHHDRHLRHRAEEVEDRQQGALHRRLGRVRPARATRTSSPATTSRRSWTPSRPARTSPTSRRSSITR